MTMPLGQHRGAPLHATTIDRAVEMITAGDIEWELTAIPGQPSDEVDQLVEALVDGVAYRALAQQAVHQIHALQGTIARLEHQRARRDDEYRPLREQVLRDAGVAP